MTIADTRKIISGSEALARQLRTEMEERGGDVAARRRAAEDGLAVRQPCIHASRTFDVSRSTAIIGRRPMERLQCRRGQSKSGFDVSAAVLRCGR